MASCDLWNIKNSTKDLYSYINTHICDLDTLLDVKMKHKRQVIQTNKQTKKKKKKKKEKDFKESLSYLLYSVKVFFFFFEKKGK